MKKLIFLFLAGITLVSCEKSVEFNNPAMQGRVNNSLWKASTATATKSASGMITIKGIAAEGNLDLTVNSTALGMRILGTTNLSNFVSYSLLNSTVDFDYTTDTTLSSVNKISISTVGSGYIDADLVATTTTSGIGSGLKVDIKANATGAITEVIVNNPGNNYRAGDLVTISGGNGNAIIQIQNVTNSNGEITITEYDGATISGKFKFIAFDSGNNEKVVCSDGVFYKVPVN